MKPSEAIDAGLCPACLGRGTLYVVIEQKLGTCRASRGQGTLAALWAALDDLDDLDDGETS